MEIVNISGGVIRANLEKGNESVEITIENGENRMRILFSDKELTDMGTYGIHGIMEIQNDPSDQTKHVYLDQ